MTKPYGRRFEDHPAEQWTPVRFMHADADCSYCGRLILKGVPGRRAGTRGTRGWWNEKRRLYECLECRSEAMRADDARASAPSEPVMERCQACWYGRLSNANEEVRPLFQLRACEGCERGAGRGCDRVCPRCGSVEHRAYGQASASEVAA